MDKPTALPHGIYAAALTPMLADLSPDISTLVAHGQWLLDSGATGLAILGTTGEANSFSLVEKKQILELAVTSGLPPEKIMVGTGGTAYTETAELTHFALELGYRHILLLPPYYYKNISDEGLFNYFRMVLDKVGSNQLGIYLYHIPKMTGINLSASLLEQLLIHFPQHFLGMKDSSGNLSHMQQVIKEFPGFSVFAGTERYLLPVLRSGGAGCISATVNLSVRKVRALYDAWQTDEADHLQEWITRVRLVLEQNPLVGTLKAYFSHWKNEPKWQNVRPPNTVIDKIELEKCLQSLDDLNFHPDNL